MPTIRQSMVAALTRRYPFYSGCGTLANQAWLKKLAGTSTERTWSRVPGGEVLAAGDDYVGRAAFYIGDLDPKVTWICDRIVRPGDTVLDIGANIGVVTLWLSTLVGEKGKVHAFEPNPELQKILKDTLVHNKVSNVQLHPIALGSQAGQLELRIPQFNAGAGSLIRNQHLSNCDIFQVPVRPLSAVVAEEKIQSIRLIKIDVEGFEAEVLKGGQLVFESLRPEAVIFELNERLEGSVRDQPAIKILRDFEYGFFAIPKCLLRMRLTRFDPDRSERLVGHDFLAVPKGECYEKIAALVNASA